MTITIVGSTKKNDDDMNAIGEIFTRAGVTVIQTVKSTENATSVDDMFASIFKNIDAADCVIAVPIEGISFDYATTAAMAYAKHSSKPVFIRYG